LGVKNPQKGPKKGSFSQMLGRVHEPFWACPGLHW